MKNLNQILEKYSNLFLLAIFVIAIVLRWWYLPHNAISFAYDQARDAFLIQEMLHGNLKILGPSVSGVPGLYHGVLYYYVIALPYLFAKGNPTIVAYFLSFVSSLGVFAVFYLTKILTKDKVPALIASLIFAFSFESSQYANLMTNASMGAWFVPVFYIGLYLWLTKPNDRKGRRTNLDFVYRISPVITGVALGFSIQSEIALAYHIVPLAIWMFVFIHRIKREDFVSFAISFLISVSTMIVSELKFGFMGVKGITYLLTGQDEIVQSKTIIDYITTLLSQSGKTFAYSLFPQNLVFGSLVGFLVIIFSLISNSHNIKKESLTWELFLSSGIFAYAAALPFGGWNMRHILVGVAPLFAAFLGIFLWKYLGKSKYVLLAVLFVILSTNLAMILKENKNGQTIFPLQVDLTLDREIAAVEYTYKASDGQPFSISSLTSPLFVNTLWSYIYNWYGYSKYDYLPSWFGQDQVGQLGNNLEFASSNVSKHFFIIEPTYGIPELYVRYARGDQEAMSKLVDEKEFGQIIVQERERTQVKE